MRRRSGTGTPSSASSFTGACIPCRPLAANGTRARCTARDPEIFKHHVETYGPQDKFGYKDFIPMFKAEHFDPEAWAAAVQKGGREVCRAGGGAS